MKGIIELNQIRNNVAHNLKDECNIDEIDLPRIDQLLEVMRVKKIKTLDTEQKIEVFTERCMRLFAYRDPQIIKIAEDIKKKYPNMPPFEYLMR